MPYADRPGPPVTYHYDESPEALAKLDAAVLYRLWELCNALGTDTVGHSALAGRLRDYCTIYRLVRSLERLCQAGRITSDGDILSPVGRKKRTYTLIEWGELPPKAL